MRPTMRPVIRPATVFVFSWLLLLITAASSWAENTCSDPDRICAVDLSVRRGDTPDVFLGPVTLKLTNINHVRYRVSVGQKVTLTDGPDLNLVGFLPSVSTIVATPAASSADAKDGGGGGAINLALPKDDPPPPPPDPAAELQAKVDDIRKCLTTTGGRVTSMLSSSNQAVNRLNARAKAVNDLVAESDQKLLQGTDGATILAKEVKTQLEGIEDDLKKVQSEWPTAQQIQEAKAKIEKAKKELAELPITESAGWGDWIYPTSNYRAYYELQQVADKQFTALQALDKDSALPKAYAEVVKGLKAWQGALQGLVDIEAFTIELPVRCGYPFFKKKTVDYTLTLVDRTKTKDNVTTEKIAQVVCPSNFTVSGGISVAGIQERDFGFVDSAPDADSPDDIVTRFGVENESNEQLNPVMLISTQLFRFGKHRAYDFHLTAGSVFDFDNPESDVEIGYLLGVSLSFKHNYFLTLGMQGGRVSELAGGFELGDERPTNLSDLPLKKDWDFGWTLGITYRIGARE